MSQENNKTLKLKLDTLKTQYDQEKLRMQTEIKALKEEIDITKDINTKFHKFKDFYLSKEHDVRDIIYEIDNLKTNVRINGDFTNKEILKKYLADTESSVLIMHIRNTLSEISINMDKLSSPNQIEFTKIDKALNILLNKLK
jgi:hypothetical protein